MSLKLLLYKIIFEEKAPKMGVVYLLAIGPENAKKMWIQDCINEFKTRYSRSTPLDVINVRLNWENRWMSTELIKGPFTNGFIIHNSCNIY